jgi:hypothetical protein
MASPFTAEIIPLPLLGAKQEPGVPPRSAPANFLDPVALARAMRDEPTRRAIEARLNGAALRERIQHREQVARNQLRIGLACCILSALVVLYFGAELLRLAF